MKEFIEKQIKAQEEYEQKYNALDEKISKCYRQIGKIEREIEKLQMERSALARPSSYDAVNALAERLSNHYGLQYKIYGPFGLNNDISIHLVKDVNMSISKQDSYSLSLRPSGSWLRYFTGENTNQYPVGSVGYMNGSHHIYAPLPVEFEEILKLVHFIKKEETA